MEALATKLSDSATTAIKQAVAQKISHLAQIISETKEAQAKGLTKKQILDDWNALTEVFKVPDDMATITTVAPKAPRAQTDKSRRCTVPKVRGANAGQPCGSFCLIGSNYCSTHAKNFPETLPTPEIPNGPPSVTASVTPSAGGCQHTLLTGSRKGSPCGSKVKANSNYCSTHFSKH